MTPAELDALADKVADWLREPMISAGLPEDVGTLLREAAKHGAWHHTMLLPLSMASGLHAHWTVNIDGSLALELTDLNGQRCWQGTFRVP